jgi:ADP-ribose pyrophosphatase
MDILKRETVFHSRLFDVQNVKVRLSNGREPVYALVKHPGAVAVVPVDGEGNIWLVKQYRVGCEGWLLEIPAGTLEPGEDPDECVQRELQEEIGMAAGKLQKLGDFYLAPGYSSERLHIYLATSLTPAHAEMDEDEVIQIEKIPVARAYAMAETGEFHDGKTLAALLMAWKVIR